MGGRRPTPPAGGSARSGGVSDVLRSVPYKLVRRQNHPEMTPCTSAGRRSARSTRPGWRGNLDVVLSERGIRTFERSTRNTLDIAAVPVAHCLSHLPVVVETSHSGGRRDLVLPWAGRPWRPGLRGRKPPDSL